MKKPKTPTQWLKNAVVSMTGRNRANKLSAPYHDWRARNRTREFLSRLPQSGVTINLGCGHRPLEGWVNVDRARGPGIDVVWDLTNELPFSSESCAAVFCEHVIEHLSKNEAESLVRECHRVLQPEGVARFSTPDAERFLRSYAGDRTFLYHSGFSQEIETPLDRVNAMMRECGQHLWVYDAESLMLLMKRAGFSEIVLQQFQQSLHPLMENVDTPERSFESFYIEAVK